MRPKLITMLTYNDETVKDAIDLFEQCSDLPCDFWGFKDIGLPKQEMKKLVNKMNDSGKNTVLEVVSLTEQECMDGAKLAVDCGFDYLMGTVFYSSISNFLKDKPIKYFPFCGKVSGHPSVITGTIQEIIEEGQDLEKFGVDGFDLLAYRYIGDCEELARSVIPSVKIPVVIAGSIDSYQRLDKVEELNPWAFTIGTALFDKKFTNKGEFRDQLKQVLAYILK